jgi:hypothetical protein
VTSDSGIKKTAKDIKSDKKMENSRAINGRHQNRIKMVQEISRC